MTPYKLSFILFLGLITFSSCKKEGCTDPTAKNYNADAKKSDASCVYDTVSPNQSYTVPSTYSFTDKSGNNTVSFSGQTERINQLRELSAWIKKGSSEILLAQDLIDMYENTNGNGNGKFTFTSTKQLKDKTFSVDRNLIVQYLQNVALASQSYNQTAAPGQAGVLTTGTKTYLFDENGKEYAEIIEKTLMGAIFMDQALNVYFGSAKMNVDNTTAVNPSANQHYTTMEHHWDEAFGYFGVDVTFPATIPTSFWGKYSNVQNAALNSNSDMMTAFLKGRAAISANVLADRDQTIELIRKEWEDICGNQAITYLNTAISEFGVDQAKFLHVVAEAYAFCWNLRYASESTRRYTPTEHADLMALFGSNFWDLSVSNLNAIKANLDSKF
jgi:hypothetical protein